ncbi:hypothetical protein [Jannaschia sp. LMIT008]|uniref:hypothetical protein n=1 Tax=Jannaschia maritima TaxID=3032585 RepID=UPI00281263C1|nr:hypothetical protein [Jannaschia sp. LMIT008]
MGFPYETADWAVVDGAMFVGWGSAMPGLYTLLAVIACAAVLIFGQRTEVTKTAAYDKR